MAKPVVASTFLTFPKFLLWGLPLGFLALTAWLSGGLDSTSISEFATRLKAVEEPIVHVSFADQQSVKEHELMATSSSSQSCMMHHSRQTLFSA
jgi:hypothetical protein